MKTLTEILAKFVIVGLTLARLTRADTITLTGTIRDFQTPHADFQTFNQTGVVTGMVAKSLGSGMKPAAGPNWSPAVSSPQSFAQWFVDTLGTNLSTSSAIVLNNGKTDPGGIYTYENYSFFPIDNQLFGNQARSHNYHFTYELHTTFTYQGGEVFSFTGDDDLWVFINNTLAVDMGGVHSAAYRSVALDTLGLVAGQTYSFDLFFAERHTGGSNFKIQTSIRLRENDTTLRIYPAVQLEWNSVTGRNYQVQWASQMNTNTWTNLDLPNPGTGKTNCVFVPARDAASKFYRLVVLP